MYPENTKNSYNALSLLASITIASPLRYAFIACQKIKDVYEYAEQNQTRQDAGYGIFSGYYHQPDGGILRTTPTGWAG
ncbi:hypothetical protein PBNK5_29750 [Pectobacterium brasiliense]